jgi:CBS domain-containing protein
MGEKVVYQGREMSVAGALRSIAPFDRLDGEVVESLAEHIRIRHYPAGEYIFRQGDESLQSLFVLLEGSVEINIFNDQDREVVTALRQPGDFLGDSAFFSDEGYLASARVAEEVTLMILPFSVFETMLSRHAEFAGAFSKVLSDRIRAIYHGQMAGQHSGYTTEQPAHKRVADLMTSPAVTCLPGETVTELARRMTARNISSVIVTEEGGRPLGIITEKDLVRKVVAAGAPAAALQAEQVMSANLLTVEPEAFYYEAMLIMVGHGIKHLAVVENGRAAGMLTIRDMVKSRGTTALNVVKAIEQQKDMAGLSEVAMQTDRVLQGLVAEGAACQDILQLMTRLFDHLTRRVIRIAEAQMVAEGFGPPPLPYSWISLGSSGRQEQFVKTDQDNGIIYDNPPPGQKEKAAAYFLELGRKVSRGLEECGFVLCPGDVMASNPNWCRSLGSWLRAVTDWVNDINPDHVRLMTVFADFRHIGGDPSLSSRLWEHLLDRIKKNPVTLHFMAQDDLSHRVPLNFFKQVITERSGGHKGQVNLKASACVHLVDGIRILALREGISATNTFLRLRALEEQNIFSAADAEPLAAAFESLLNLRIARRLEQISSGDPQTDYINPAKLSRRDKAALREAFITTDRLQSILSHTWSQS